MYIKVKLGLHFVLDSNNGTESNENNEFSISSAWLGFSFSELTMPVGDQNKHKEHSDKVTIISKTDQNKEKNKSIDQAVNLCIKFCIDSNIQNRVEILKSAQQHILQGTLGYKFSLPDPRGGNKLYKHKQV